MYQGVLRDEARVRDKALALLSTPSPSPPRAHSSGTPLNTPSSPVQQPISTSSPVLQPNSTSSPVLQPDPSIDEDCATCVISPPARLVEAQSADRRAREREDRQVEYEAQRQLGEKLGREQGVDRDRIV